MLQADADQQTADKSVQDGYKLLKQVPEFDAAEHSWPLIEVGGAFKIYIEYKPSQPPEPRRRHQDRDRAASTSTWTRSPTTSGRPLEEPDERRRPGGGPGPDRQRLMTIKGNWDARNGAESQYGGSDSDPGFPVAADRVRPGIEAGHRNPADPAGPAGRELQGRLPARPQAGDEQQGRHVGIQARGLQGNSGRALSDAGFPVQRSQRAAQARGGPASWALTSTRRSRSRPIPKQLLPDRRRLPGLLRPAVGHVRVAVDRHRLRRRPGRTWISRADTKVGPVAAHEIRLRRAAGRGPAGGRQRQRALHGRRRNLRRLRPR